MNTHRRLNYFSTQKKNQGFSSDFRYVEEFSGEISICEIQVPIKFGEVQIGIEIANF